MSYRFLINSFLVLAMLVCQDLCATSGKKKDTSLVEMRKNKETKMERPSRPARNKKKKNKSAIVTNNNNTTQLQDDFCESMCMLVPGFLCGVATVYGSVTSEMYLDNACFPSEAFTNLFQHAMVGGFGGMALGKVAHNCYKDCQLCKKKKQD